MSNGHDASGDASSRGQSARELADQVRFLEAEVTDLRRRLADAPTQSPAAWSSGWPTRSAPWRPSRHRTSASRRPCARPATRSSS